MLEAAPTDETAMFSVLVVQRYPLIFRWILHSIFQELLGSKNISPSNWADQSMETSFLHDPVQIKHTNIRHVCSKLHFLPEN